MKIRSRDLDGFSDKGQRDSELTKIFEDIIKKKRLAEAMLAEIAGAEPQPNEQAPPAQGPRHD